MRADLVHSIASTGAFLDQGNIAFAVQNLETGALTANRTFETMHDAVAPFLSEAQGFTTPAVRTAVVSHPSETTGRPVVWTATPIFDDAGSVVAIAVYGVPAAEAGNQMADRLVHAVEKAPLPILLYDDKGEIILRSDAWFEQSGFPQTYCPTVQAWCEQARLEPSPFFDVLRAETRSPRQDAPRRLEFVTASGKRAVWDLYTTVLSASPAGHRAGIAMAIDMTDELASRKKLSETVEELRHFAYVASHDLHEPLRSISGFVQLLERRYSDRLDDRAKRYVSRVIAATGRMQDLLDDLLVYSRLTTKARHPEPCDAAAAVNAAAENLNQQIQDSNARITVSKLPVVVCDPVQLVQLFQNLVGNAIKFHGQSPPVVEVEFAGVESKSFGTDAHAVICVRDRGIGIDPTMSDRIFQVFQRLHGIGEYSGTGIGLAICKKIIERHGGRIWVDSQPGQGAAFYFTLPATELPKE